MPDLNLTETDLVSAKNELASIDTSVSSLNVCYDPLSVFGDSSVAFAVDRAQQIITIASSSLTEVKNSQQVAIDSIKDSMAMADQLLADGAA